MRILPDTRDLIDLTERNIPLPAHAFQEFLNAHNYQIVLTFTNIRELAGPLARGGDFLQIRRLLQALEVMPHTYMQEVSIVAVELGSAVKAFNEGTEYEPISPYVPRWDRTISVMQQRPALENVVGLRLDHIVYDLFDAIPDLFGPPTRHLPQLIRQFENDRAVLKAGRAPAREHFFRHVRKNAATWRVALPAGREDEFSTWIYRNPNRCPGLRLNHETYRQLMRNYGDTPEVGDFSDLAHISAIPYIEAVTLDNRMREYCSSASRRLSKLGAIDYRNRLFRNLNEWMRAQA